MSRWVRYTKDWYKMEFCHELACELRESGQYGGVRVRSKVWSEDGLRYGRVYVQQPNSYKEEENT